MEQILFSLTEKKKLLDRSRPLPPKILSNLEEWFKVELTYTSNAIEGNTLSRAETALVVEKGITVNGKSLKEHLEAVNHVDALEYINTLANKEHVDITERVILDIHRMILSKIDDRNAGRYRNVPVRIAGSRAIMPNPNKVRELTEKYTAWLQTRSNAHPATLAAEAHYRLVSIHPFTDGNGRTARLLMNLLLIQEGYPLAIISNEDRLSYINSIENAQLGGSLDDFMRIVYKAVDRSLDIYLESINQSILHDSDSVDQPKSTNLLKIGELAKLCGEPVHTLRFWTKEGLLEVAAFSQGGYQLYDPSMANRVKEIRYLQNQKRLTLKEIKAGLEQQ